MSRIGSTGCGTDPIAPVWVSNESCWNGGWWAPGCCDLARKHICGILYDGRGRFEFDHDDEADHDDIGCFLPNPNFCPWCGAPIPREVPENP